MAPPSDRPFSILLDLPVDIYQQVTSLLEPADLVCLGLTCWGLWSFIGKDTVEAIEGSYSGLGQREEILNRLARESSDLAVCCHWCLQLRKLHFAQELSVSNQWLRPPCKCIATQVNICKHYSITREMLELALKPSDVVDARVRGSTPFAHSCSWRTTGHGGGELALAMESKIVGGGLHLKLTYTAEMQVDARNSFGVPSMRAKGCRHVGLWLKRKCECAIRHAIKGELPCTKCSRPQRCLFCFTHHLISAALKGPRRVHLEIRVYRYLGAGLAGGNKSEEAWEAQITSLSKAEWKGVHVHQQYCSLEDVFERSQPLTRSGCHAGATPECCRRKLYGC